MWTGRASPSDRAKLCGKADGETRFPALLLDQAARFALSVAVGEGQVFVVPGRRRYRHHKLIVTAAHCLPGLPPPMGPRIPRSTPIEIW